MVLSLWRYAHLALAIISSLFLIILSVTGVILAFDAVYQKTPPLKVENFDTLNLSQVIPDLQKVYSEIISITVDHRGFVSIDAIDANGEAIKGYIDPNSGQILSEIKPQSQFIQWTTALHRSLFLKETGRLLVGTVSFILVLISITGIALLLKRQKGIKHVFDKIQKDFFSQYFHVVTGRLALLPILLIALTGTFLFLLRLDMFKVDVAPTPILTENTSDETTIPVQDFPIFKSTLLKDVEQIDFPFIPDDPEELFIIKLKDQFISINQLNGTLVEQTIYPIEQTWERWNLDLHTGRTSILLAIILGLASINILVFIYTGFVITFKRSRTKIKNKYTHNQAEIIILYGSENGSTLYAANQIHRQLLSSGQKSYIAGFNQYQAFQKAKQILLFTSTYGLGDPPSNADKFVDLVQKHPQAQDVLYAVVGFGSKAYPDYCAYAQQVDLTMEKQAWASPYLPIHLINDRSADDLMKWVNAYIEKSALAIATDASVYCEKPKKMHQWKVVEKTATSTGNSTFKVVFEPQSNVSFKSGDLFAIYPAHDYCERLYSVAKCGNKLQLIVKKHAYGLGSNYLHDLTLGDSITARVMTNAAFHFPRRAKQVALIFNGTGIAPFLGMIDENHKKAHIHLYGGFRHDNNWVEQYKQFAEARIHSGKLQDYKFAYSREASAQYVMDLIQQDADRFAALLHNDGAIMICGSLAMLRDVEQTLEQIVLSRNGKPLSYYKNNNQFYQDCY